MKSFLIGLVVGLSLACLSVKGQDADTNLPAPWNHYLGASFYIIKDDFFVLPVYQVNKDWLHLEARYNYEDRNTFSAWFGYNFSGGNKFGII
jgi:hypothetical protein